MTMSNGGLSGVFPVICTPFDERGAIDEADFDRVVDFVVGSGADGVVFPGVASEVGSLTGDERHRLVARLGRRLSRRTAFVVGASASDPDQAASHALAGADIGAAAAMIMAPSGVAAQDEIVAFFAAIARQLAGAPIRIMLQNAPAPVGAGLAPERVAEIVAAVPAIRWVKEETQPCGQNISRLLAAAGDRLEGIFGGAGARYLIDELRRGAAGTMPASELADVHVAIVAAWRAGNETEARRLFAAALPLLNHQAVFRMDATKTVLARRGIISATGVRDRSPRMDRLDRVELDALLADTLDLFANHRPGEAAA